MARRATSFTQGGARTRLALVTGADEVLRLTDGRAVSLRRFGARGGAPVLALHGTPGSRLKFAPADADAQALGIELISLDRWGYGASEAPRRPRPLAAYASDLIEIADRLDLPRFGVVGISGGGPFAAAVAAVAGARVSALALVSPVGPIVGTPVDDQLRFFHRFAFQFLPRLPGAVRAIFTLYSAVLVRNPQLAISVASSRAAKPDRLLLATTDVRDRLAHSFAAGLRAGVDGPVIDMALFCRPWAIDVSQIAAPSRLWLGTEDTNVPQASALLLARTIPGCELTRLEGAGHFWISESYGEVLSWLARHVPGASRPPGLG